MDPFTVGAVVAAGAAGAAYLDAKYAIRKDLEDLRIARNGNRLLAEAVKQKRVCLYYQFEDSVKKRGDAECIWSREGCYTWNQTYDMAHRYANWFLSMGVKPGDYVAFYLINSPDFLFAWMGLWAIGAAPAMINYHLANKSLVHCLKVPGAKLLLVDPDQHTAQRIEDERLSIESEAGMQILFLDDAKKQEIRGLPSTRPSDDLRAQVKADWPMCMFFTSGTTGMPKGCPFSMGRGFFAGIARTAGSKRMKDDDRYYDCMPLYHGTGGVTAVTQLMSGITVCVGRKFSTTKFWQDIHDSRATHFVYVGETARYLLSAPPSSLDKGHNVRVIYGNGLRPDVWVKFQERFNIPEVEEFFNSSEGVLSLLNTSKNSWFVGAVGHHGGLKRLLYGNMYVPVLTDDDGNIVRSSKTGFATQLPHHVGGEILVRVPNEKVFGGYHGNEAATKKKFERDVFKKGDLFYRSGDALYRDVDGRWHFKDRLGDTFRWKGENVSTAEVQAVLGKFEGITEAIVYGVEVPNHDGKAGCAALFIEPALRANFDFTTLLRYLRSHLPAYATPIFIRLVHAMAPIHNNKQNKVPLRNEGIDPDKVGPSGEEVLWVEGLGKGSKYVKFTRADWDALKAGQVGGRTKL